MRYAAYAKLVLFTIRKIVPYILYKYTSLTVTIAHTVIVIRHRLLFVTLLMRM